MSLDGLTLFTMLACASAGAGLGAVFGGARVASLRARHAHMIKGVRLALYHLERGHSKTLTMNALNDALDTDRQITIAIQEGFPEQAGPWPDPHSEPSGDIPDIKHIRVGDRDNG
ncbi:MAG: hypothetical protein RL492_1766 [Verrucomicrobiota bacterium]|jgi:acyl-coenzyme A synthetase/AMP-(fatty) acid ligase